MKRFLRGLNQYIVFFLMVAFLVTCCIMLFTSALMDSLGIVLTGENLGTAAKLTFANVILLSVLFTVFDTIRRSHSEWKRVIISFTAVSAVLFIAFYPVLSGADISTWYTNSFLRWLPKSWPF